MLYCKKCQVFVDSRQCLILMTPLEMSALVSSSTLKHFLSSKMKDINVFTNIVFSIVLHCSLLIICWFSVWNVQEQSGEQDNSWALLGLLEPGKPNPYILILVWVSKSPLLFHWLAYHPLTRESLCTGAVWISVICQVILQGSPSRNKAWPWTKIFFF